MPTLPFSGSATGANDLKPVGRLLTGRADVSEAIYRLAAAARENRRLVEEVRLEPALNGRSEVGWYRVRVAPVRRETTTATLWTVSDVTPERACAHPNWRMGRKISVDSATLMNKGLEVIEAHYLFDAPAERIDVVVHRQSIVHSLVEYVDGSVLAQLGNPDMRTAIAYGLAWPERVETGVAPLDLLALARLDFEAPDLATFRCLALAYQALRAGGIATTTLNAANEEAVAAFLDHRLPFLAIAQTIERCLEALPSAPASDLATLLDADLTARRQAQRIIRELGIGNRE